LNYQHHSTHAITQRDAHRPVVISLRHPPMTPLFPYTTLFRSDDGDEDEPPGDVAVADEVGAQRALAARAPHAERGCAEQVGEHRSEEHTSELQSRSDLVCRLLLEKKKKKNAKE